MSKVEEIKTAIESLEEEEYAQLRSWFDTRNWEEWDREIEADLESGKLNFLIKEALEEKANVI